MSNLVPDVYKRQALINRIDRNTGGIVMAAKNAETLRIMNEKVKQRELTKLYLCIVHGHMPKREETLEGFLEKNESQNRVYISPVSYTHLDVYKRQPFLHPKGRKVQPSIP